MRVAIALVRRQPVTAALLAGALTTVLATVTPGVDLAYRSPGAHLVLDTAAGLIALLTAYLVAGRYRIHPTLSTLLLAEALALFAVSNLLFVALRLSSGDARAVTWTSVAISFLGAALFTASAFAPVARLRDSARLAPRTAAATAVATAGVAAAAFAAASDLPEGVDPRRSPPTGPHVTGHAGVLALQLAGAALFFAAAAGFARRGKGGDPLLRWLAGGAVLGGVAYVNYFLFPSLYSDWTYTGDVLKAASYLVLLAGCVSEIGAYWRAVAEAAVLDERRRLARDLHDGLAQELAYIAANARSPAVDAERVAAAAERALDESRRAIAALARPGDEPFPVAVAHVAEEVGARAGLRLRFALDAAVEPDPRARDALLRVVHEAVTNAGRHARASSVRVELTNGDGIRLRVTDDGEGFVRARSAAGFGLTSMSERVEALGGVLTIASERGEGTRVEVSLPTGAQPRRSAARRSG